MPMDIVKENNYRILESLISASNGTMRVCIVAWHPFCFPCPSWGLTDRGCNRGGGMQASMWRIRVASLGHSTLGA